MKKGKTKKMDEQINNIDENLIDEDLQEKIAKLEREIQIIESHYEMLENAKIKLLILEGYPEIQDYLKLIEWVAFLEKSNLLYSLSSLTKMNQELASLKEKSMLKLKK